MKRNQQTHRQINDSNTHQMNLQLGISTLLVVVLLSLPFFGCGTVMGNFIISKGKYVAPELPKSELAAIQIDIESGWLQRYKLIVLRIDGRLALREKIEADADISIDEILIAPGKHDISLSTILDRFDGDTPSTVQMMSIFSAEVEAGSTYLLQADNKLVDAETGKVVSESKIF